MEIETCFSAYCINNTGYYSYDDNYNSGGTHNGQLYWTGVSNNLYIYYSSEVLNGVYHQL